MSNGILWRQNSLPGFCFSAVARWQDSFILTMIWEVLDHRENKKKQNPLFMWLASEVCWRAVTGILSVVKDDIYRHAGSSRGCGTATAFPKLTGFCLSLVRLWLKHSTKIEKSIYQLSVQLEEFLKKMNVWSIQSSDGKAAFFWCPRSCPQGGPVIPLPLRNHHMLSWHQLLFAQI